MIRRSPDGKFCDPWYALDAWLPKLLNQARQSTIFPVVLKSLSLLCVRRAGNEYAEAARYFTDDDRTWLCQAGFASRKHEEAQRWFAKRDILLKALADIEAVDAPRF